MSGIERITGVAAPLLLDNINTDAIIPSREMRSTGKTGFADGLFAGWRYQETGGRVPRPEFILNQPAYSEAEILLGGKNFGSGSSREHAVWALKEYGIAGIIAVSFAPIFFDNCIRNGIVPVVLSRAALETIAAIVEIDPQNRPLTISLSDKTVSSSTGECWSFELGEEALTMLVEGLDVIALTMKMRATIAAFHETDRRERPWIYLGEEHEC
jgi:3-isopropylmalate/(R)-2-methylmalate dehydratase small subunit